MRVEPVVVDHAGAVGCRDEELLDLGGPGEAQDGAAAEAEFTGDGSQDGAAFDAFVDLLVAFAGASDERALTSVHVEFAQGGEAAVVLAGLDSEGFAQVGAVSSDDAVDGLGEVVQKKVSDANHIPHTQVMPT